MRRKLIVIGSAGALAGTLLAGGAWAGTGGGRSSDAGNVSAVSAAAASCPRGYVCLWTKKNYKGTQWKVKLNSPVQVHTAPASFRNKATSLIVGSGRTVTLWNDVDCVEDPGPTFRAGARIPDLQTPWAYDDLMSCLVG
ncbi:peptidase inhibitor family I36 protein [Actinomadura chibensis]|uniref:peptidase inhibitor family I36 protein n=1 Tax=Actinomadura chibensis TaxID=392828 RepID=UPI000A81B1D1|nr:peptidase inhibitor family I36 protein [Actinomadura chibensis]